MHQMMRLNMTINFLSYLSIIHALFLFELGRVRNFKRTPPLPATSVQSEITLRRKRLLVNPLMNLTNKVIDTGPTRRFPHQGVQSLENFRNAISLNKKVSDDRTNDPINILDYRK